MYCGFTELKPHVQDAIRQQFSDTERSGHKFTDYLYELTRDGKVLSRKLID